MTTLNSEERRTTLLKKDIGDAIRGDVDEAEFYVVALRYRQEWWFFAFFGDYEISENIHGVECYFIHPKPTRKASKFIFFAKETEFDDEERFYWNEQNLNDLSFDTENFVILKQMVNLKPDA